MCCVSKSSFKSDKRSELAFHSLMTGRWLVVLRLNVPVNNFSVMSGRSHRFLGN